ncbi:MAG: DUF805 domain-containing protein [Rhodospirillaceae bacterium]
MPPMPWSDLLFSFEGRIRRSDFWLRWTLPVTVVFIGFAALVAVMEADAAIATVFYLVALYPGLAVNVKRCHDRGRSGWFFLINFIPLIGGIWYFIDVGCLRGTVGDNRFGPDPLGDQTVP